MTKLKDITSLNITKQKYSKFVIKSKIEIYYGNKIKVKINNQLLEENTINYGV
jgi:hypothetical protein